jgi:hypothetical protein
MVRVRVRMPVSEFGNVIILKATSKNVIPAKAGI